MGRRDDRMAVCDPAGAVIGVEGLTVCDASLMPSIPCANLNLPIIMMAEKIADGLKRTL
jgi:5-(hydroxymethyl)furfural/furfural oxidase